MWGPVLWNTFFEDARQPVKDAGFTEAVYADDLLKFTGHVRRSVVDGAGADRLFLLPE